MLEESVLFQKEMEIKKSLHFVSTCAKAEIKQRRARGDTIQSPTSQRLSFMFIYM